MGSTVTNSHTPASPATHSLAQFNREHLILSRLDQVRDIAGKFVSTLPGSATLDDLTSAGTLGLIAAVDRYDPSRCLQLNNYAERKIRGAILDFLRTTDQAPPDGGYCVSAVGDNLTPSPACVAEQRENQRVLASCLKRLPVNERAVLMLHYFHDVKMSNIASVLRIHPRRVSQLKNRALLRLRTQLSARNLVRRFAFKTHFEKGSSRARIGLVTFPS
jgi:RNA polymerase sigma factor (sigma-70 family)